MQESHREYIESYNELSVEDKKRHKDELKEIIGELGETTGNYPVILGLLLSANKEFTVLLNGNTEPLTDTEFKKKLGSDYKKAVYEYQKRLVIICDLCLEDKSAQNRFCGSFTSFENVESIAELISVPFGVLRRLQKTSEDRRKIARVRSCAVKLKTTLEHMQEMINNAEDIEKI